MVKHLYINEINELPGISNECQVIGIREFSESNGERIADAQLMPLSNFETPGDKLDRTRPVYLMCGSGNRVKQAAEKLNSKGFTGIYVIEGGKIAWKEANLPVINGESKVWRWKGK